MRHIERMMDEAVYLLESGAEDEYRRGIVELITFTMGLSGDQLDAVAELIYMPREARARILYLIEEVKHK